MQRTGCDHQTQSRFVDKIFDLDQSLPCPLAMIAGLAAGGKHA